MKKVELNKITLRILAATIMAILFYNIFSLINYWFSIRGIGLIPAFSSSFIAILSAYLINQMKDTSKGKKILIAAGLLISLLLSSLFKEGRSIPEMFISFAEYFTIWTIATNKVCVVLSSLYYKELFYRDLFVIFTVNIFYYIFDKFRIHSPEVSNSSILYIILSLILLMGLRSADVMKSSEENGKRIYQEVLKLMAIIAVIFIFSSSWLQGYLILFIKFVGGIVFSIVGNLAKPLLQLLAFIALKLRSLVHFKGGENTGINSNSRENNYDEFTEFDSRNIEKLGEVLSVIFVILAGMLIMYYTYKHYLKNKEKNNQDDFFEKREFIVPEKLKNKNALLNNIKGKFSNIVEVIKLEIGNDYDMKIRNEYKKLIVLIKKKELIKGSNKTAATICEELISKLKQKDEAKKITTIYEKIRYGGIITNKEEYENFSKAMKNIAKELN